MITIVFVTLLTTGLFLDAAPSKAQQGREEEMRAAQPGPVHKQLAKRAGEYTTRTHFTAPGAPAQDFDGTAKITPVLEGRFLLEEYAGTLLGKPVQGMRLLGYNNHSKKYEGIWTYTRSTGIMRLVGIGDADGKTIKLTATYDGPSGKQTLHVAIRGVDDDHFIVELISKKPDGSTGSSLVTTYTRKK